MSAPLHGESFLQRLYDDASSGRGLQAALAETAIGFNATVAHLLASDVATQVPMWAVEAGLDKGAYTSGEADYVAHHWRTDPRRRGMGLLVPGGSWRCQRIIEDREVEKNEFFQDFFLPLQLRWSMVGRIAAPVGADALTPCQEVVDLALVRPPNAGEFSASDQLHFEQLLPHLRSALGVQRQLAQATAAEQTLASVAVGSVVLDDQYRPLWATPGTLQQLSAQVGSLRFGPAALRRSLPQLDQALRKVLANGHVQHVAIGPEHGATERLWLTITRRTGHAGEPGNLQLLMLLRWPDRRQNLQPEVLMQLLSLTRREAEMGCALVEGRTPREMWTAKGLSAPTVRSQLSSLYAKTGTKGQVEFVKLVAGLTLDAVPKANG